MNSFLNKRGVFFFVLIVFVFEDLRERHSLCDIQITLARLTMDLDMNHENNRLATMMGLVGTVFDRVDQLLLKRKW